jgi:hypothetical protein
MSSTVINCFDCHTNLLTQGLEIVNPQAAEKKVSEANIRYFSNQGTFFNVKDVSSTPLPGASSMKKE